MSNAHDRMDAEPDEARRQQAIVQEQDVDRLFKLAVIAFDAIETNTGSRLWTPPAEPSVAAVKDAMVAFESLVKRHGLAWLIDAASGTGMAHMGWSYWMKDARELVS